MFNKIMSLWSQDMAIDLGTANTLVYVKVKALESYVTLGRSCTCLMVNYLNNNRSVNKR